MLSNDIPSAGSCFLSSNEMTKQGTADAGLDVTPLIGSTSGLPTGILNVVVGGASEAEFKAQDVVQRLARGSMMTLKELADALENIDEEAFASLLLEFELNHDDGPKQVKMMIIDALRFSDQHGLRASRPPLDEAD
jgi:hypothetical protein